tara:strand:+ start:5024 stop:5593 length:570 start_codon:yes stop_codon:yes gene_type:complete
MATNGKLSSRDLIGSLIESELELDLISCSDMTEDERKNQIAAIEQGVKEIKKELSNKVSGIDYFMLELNKKDNIIDAEIDTLMKEVKRLRTRKKAIKKTEDYMNKELLPMIVETAGENGVFNTNTTRYKLYETWGKLEVIDEDAIQDKYKRYKVEIDKKNARKDVIDAAENGMGISGFKIEKTKRIRRS